MRDTDFRWSNGGASSTAEELLLPSGADLQYPLLASSTWVGSIRAWAIGTGSAYADATSKLSNTTAAALGAQQNSPIHALAGQCWETTGGTSQEASWGTQVRPVQGATATSTLNFLSSANGSAYTSRAYFNHSGQLFLTGYLSCTQVIASSYVKAANTLQVTTNADQGLGTAYGFFLSGGSQILLNTSRRTNAANNIVQAIIWDVASYPAVPNDYLKFLSLGYTGAATTYTESYYFGYKHMQCPVVTVATAPANPPAGTWAYFSDGSAGAPCWATGDGSTWKVTAIVSATDIASS